MFELKFSDDQIPRHQCIGVREGNWLIFKCCECAYIRKINSKTGKSTTYNGNFEILHEGIINETAAPDKPTLSSN